jgi:hypothetical protein
VAKKDQKELKKMLSGGVQQVRTVLRAVTLLQLGKGVSAPRIAEFVPLTPQAIRKVGHRYMGGLERAVFEKERPGAAAEGQREAAYHRHGLCGSAGRTCTLDRANGRGAGCKAANSPAGRTRNDSDSAA